MLTVKQLNAELEAPDCLGPELVMFSWLCDVRHALIDIGKDAADNEARITRLSELAKKLAAR